jgi:hypothetical protein
VAHNLPMRDTYKIGASSRIRSVGWAETKAVTWDAVTATTSVGPEVPGRECPHCDRCSWDDGSASYGQHRPSHPHAC